MTVLRIVTAALCLSAVAAPSHDQVIDKKALSLAAAKKIASAAEAEATAKNARVVIAVVDDGGNLLVLQRLDDTQVASVEVGIGKARTAAIFCTGSMLLCDRNSRTRVQLSPPITIAASEDDSHAWLPERERNSP